MTEQNPDHDIEFFWLNFKQSMLNFYKSYEKQFKQRDITTWSSVLNKLQSEQKYLLIERQIRDYMICYGIDVIRSASHYHLGILKSNVHRWDLLSKQFGLLKEHPEYAITFHTRTMFHTCLEISFALNKSGIRLDLFDDIELIIIQENIAYFIEMAILWGKSSIFDILLKNHKTETVNELKKKYGDDVFQGVHIETLKGKTLLKFLDKHER